MPRNWPNGRIAIFGTPVCTGAFIKKINYINFIILIVTILTKIKICSDLCQILCSDEQKIIFNKFPNLDSLISLASSSEEVLIFVRISRISSIHRIS